MTLSEATRPSPTTSGLRDWKAILVHVEADAAAAPRLAAALALARRFDAHLIGVAAQYVDPAILGSGPGAVEAYAALREQCVAELAAAGERFRAMATDCSCELRTVEDRPAWAISTLSRSADVIVAGGSSRGAVDRSRRAAAAEIALASGRPVLVAPVAGSPLRAEAVVIAWRDTREARRAVADALPLLQRARDVIVLQVCGEDERATAELAVREVAEALKRHAAPARPRVVCAPDDAVADMLRAEARASGADLIVAGCYGHSRTREWVFGGVSRELMREPEGYLLISH